MIIQIADKKYHVEYVEDAKRIAKMIRIDEPKWITFDTETTGLHLKKDVPFLGAVCWTVPFNEQLLDGVVYVFPTTPQNLARKIGRAHV